MSPNASYWMPIGPAPIKTTGGNLGFASGRIEAVAADPANPSVLFVAGQTGGIWKNLCGGVPPGWTPLTDDQLSISVSGYHTLAVYPANHNIVFAAVSGSGEVQKGGGILVSLNGGLAWQRLGAALFDAAAVNAIAIHPTNPNLLWLSAGSLGIFGSSDGGVTWAQIGTLPSGNVTDLIAVNASPPSAPLLYAAVVGNTGGAIGQNGAYRSTDGGQQWQLMTDLPHGAAMTTSELSTGWFTGTVRFEAAASSPEVLYATALFIDASNAFAVGRYKTLDGGVSWTPLQPSPGSVENRSWHVVLGVDPGNENHILVNDAYSLYESYDGGSHTWSRADGAAGFDDDWVNIAFDANGNALVTGDQGGVYRYSPQTHVWTSLTGNLAVTQFYSITLAGNDAAYGVAQDVLTIGGLQPASPGPWNWSGLNIGEEIGRVLADPTNPKLIYIYTASDGTVSVSSNGGLTGTQVLSNVSNGFDPKARMFVMDPSNPARLLLGTTKVWETTNASSSPPTWSAISGDLSPSPGGSSWITALAIAPTDGNTVYAATQDGHVWLSGDGGKSWNECDKGLYLPNAHPTVLQIVISPGDKSRAFAIADGTNITVWELQGGIWTNISSSFPADLIAVSLFVDWRYAPAYIYAGTARGVYRSADGGNTWTKFGLDLPNAEVSDLQAVSASGLLLAGTYGRGAWLIVLPPPA